MIIHLIDGQPMPLTIGAKWVHVEKAEHPFTMHIDETSELVKLSETAVYHHSTDEIGRVFLTGSGAIEIETGAGTFTPPVKGQQVEVAAMPAVEVSKLPAVDVATMPAVEVSKVPAVDVSTMPAVEVSKVPAVDVATMPAVEVSQVPAVDVATMPAVEVSKLPAVNAYVLASGRFETHAFDTFPASIAKDDARKGLTLKAHKDNTGAIELMDAATGAEVYELDAGEVLQLAVKSEIFINAQAGDRLMIIEV
ncbi:hypothetical protein GT360_07305 [Vibrio astriarenae]|uniref:Uncharacterized protein n=1 Tax=Vibrio astriarenae TaxID=1481923 RepID=A0A7Z2T323_9VIBR|nr:hypothetical protein [Vibrio astriarenae]QIA63337.1 hypothetical protein GT360_07305 [Vibrio astriarenae]